MERRIILEDDIASGLMDEITDLEGQIDELRDIIRNLESEISEKDDTIASQDSAHREYIVSSLSDLEFYAHTQIENRIESLLGQDNIDYEEVFSETLDYLIPDQLLMPLATNYRLYMNSDIEDYTLEHSYDHLIQLINTAYHIIIREYPDSPEKVKAIKKEIFKSPSDFKVLLLLDILKSSINDGCEILNLIDESDSQEYFFLLNSLFFDKSKRRYCNYLKSNINPMMSSDFKNIIFLGSYFYYSSHRSGDFENIFRTFITQRGAPNIFSNASSHLERDVISENLWALIGTVNNAGLMHFNEILKGVVEFPRDIQNKINYLKLKGEI